MAASRSCYGSGSQCDSRQLGGPVSAAAAGGRTRTPRAARQWSLVLAARPGQAQAEGTAWNPGCGRHPMRSEQRRVRNQGGAETSRRAPPAPPSQPSPSPPPPDAAYRAAGFPQGTRPAPPATPPDAQAHPPTQGDRPRVQGHGGGGRQQQAPSSPCHGEGTWPYRSSERGLREAGCVLKVRGRTRRTSGEFRRSGQTDRQRTRGEGADGMDEHPLGSKSLERGDSGRHKVLDAKLCDEFLQQHVAEGDALHRGSR